MGENVDVFGGFRRIFGGKQKPVEVSLRQPDLDSTLITSISTGQQAVDALQNSETTATTKREVWDRLLRASGKKAFLDPEAYPNFLRLQALAQGFYKAYYLDGLNLMPDIPPDLLAQASTLRIENSNRNLASKFFEGTIKHRTEEVQSGQNNLDKPIVVSVAFGGNEPALLLASMLDTEILHLKPPPGVSGQTEPLWLGNPSDLTGKKVILVDDRVKTGDTFEEAKQAVTAFRPQQLSELIVVPNP